MRENGATGRLLALTVLLALLSGCAAGAGGRAAVPQPPVDPQAEAAIADESFRKAAALSRDGRMAEAAPWFERAATRGHTAAQVTLGTMYLLGRGVPRDPAKAAGWYRMAAEAGDAWAQFSLGKMYLGGNGVPRDLDEGIRLQRLAAEQGHPGAQYNMGALYYNGEGVERDYAAAALWLERAARQGDTAAQLVLGRMYSTPHKGVRLDRVRAYAWLSLAATAGNEEAGAMADELRRGMSAAERVAARSLARRLSQDLPQG